MTATEAPASRSARVLKRERQRVMRELVEQGDVESQEAFVTLLAERGFAVTQATVSRDIAELGLAKVARGDRHVYVSPERAVDATRTADAALRRLLADLPITVRRSGLILLLVATPGSAGAIAEAIDRSSFMEQEGTLAGDNTVLVLFADEARLERWRERFEAIRAGAAGGRQGRP